MSSVFVIQNQHGQFLSRQKEWLDKTEINALFKTPHHDLAINELFEVTSKHSDVRAKVIEAQTSSKGLPLVADLPPLQFPKIDLPDDLAALEDNEACAATEEAAATSEVEPSSRPDAQTTTADDENPQSKDLATDIGV